MWLVYAALTGIFLTVAVTALVHGQYGWTIAFCVIAALYAALGAREIREGNGKR